MRFEEIEPFFNAGFVVDCQPYGITFQGWKLKNNKIYSVGFDENNKIKEIPSCATLDTMKHARKIEWIVRDVPDINAVNMKQAVMLILAGYPVKVNYPLCGRSPTFRLIDNQHTPQPAPEPEKIDHIENATNYLERADMDRGSLAHLHSAVSCIKQEINERRKKYAF